MALGLRLFIVSKTCKNLLVESWINPKFLLIANFKSGAYSSRECGDEIEGTAVFEGSEELDRRGEKFYPIRHSLLECICIR